MIEENVKQEAGWNFDNSYAGLSALFYSKMGPNPVSEPELVILNEKLAVSMGLNPDALRGQDEIDVFAGNRVPEGAEPLAQAYAGHQFGHFTMLGDGRALLLGEQMTPGGERLDVQLKGSGRTPYSRRGDGRAALGPMLREYIISEAMHALGIPTTRSLAVVTTGEPVYRETVLQGAVLTRIAASHLRVGTFQYAAGAGSAEELRELADYALRRHYGEPPEPEENRYVFLLREVLKRQASLIAQWQLVGFIHGVMNTDNMAISGETIDYGPCAFMDTYDPATVFSSIDTNGRYAYRNQPYIGVWNLARLAESLLPLLHDDEEQAVKVAEDVLSEFNEHFQRNYLSGMRAKLGLFGEEEDDDALIQELLKLMEEHRADYTNTFRALTLGKPEATALHGIAAFGDWQAMWQARLGRQQETEEASRELMRRSNPAVIPRNHRVEEALEAAAERSDYAVMEKLLRALANPYAYSPDQEEYAELPASCNSPYQTFCGT
ncbi:protein adenylyltransferase SelO [Paenibacillus soyae]|uniref:Protein nucleotidyltransferase YdiU n=1 Tax=Paenibacillus soyae TaxID=2969249 RepID=A0A9X2SCP2_9BACL|nr:YdiU family protein [Paenibacillus soyae]MCR2806978.1 YdiU family protein [Paenibacillus soyae]